MGPSLEESTAELIARIASLEQALHAERERGREKDEIICELQARIRGSASSDDEEESSRCGCLLSSSRASSSQPARGQTRDGARDTSGASQAATSAREGAEEESEEDRRQASGSPLTLEYGPVTKEQHCIDESARRPPPQPPQGPHLTNLMSDEEKEGVMQPGDGPSSTSFSKRSSRRVVFAEGVKGDSQGPGPETGFFSGDLRDLSHSFFSRVSNVSNVSGFLTPRADVEGAGGDTAEGVDGGVADEAQRGLAKLQRFPYSRTGIEPAVQSVPRGLDANSWEEAEANTMPVRGAQYLKDKVKFPSLPAAFKLVEIEGFSTRTKTHFSTELASSFYNRSRAAGSKAFLLVVHFDLHPEHTAMVFEVRRLLPLLRPLGIVGSGVRG